MSSNAPDRLSVDHGFHVWFYAHSNGNGPVRLCSTTEPRFSIEIAKTRAAKSGSPGAATALHLEARMSREALASSATGDQAGYERHRLHDGPYRLALLESDLICPVLQLQSMTYWRETIAVSYGQDSNSSFSDWFGRQRI
jgi:hypothetical protein